MLEALGNGEVSKTQPAAPNVRIISAIPTERQVSKSGAEGFIQSLWRAVEKLLLVEVWV